MEAAQKCSSDFNLAATSNQTSEIEIEALSTNFGSIGQHHALAALLSGTEPRKPTEQGAG
jgi:hypothetical protein